MVVPMSNELDDKLQMLEENYDTIIKLMNEISLTNDKLEMIKAQFIDQIASTRRYDNIKSMKDLLEILQKRCIIDYVNIGKLYNIVEELEGEKCKPQLAKALIRHSRWLLKVPKIPVKLEYHFGVEVDSEIAKFTLPDIVVNTISSQISRGWSKFARALKIISEKEIDRIDGLDNAVKTRKCLETFVIEAQRQYISNPYEILLQALDVIGRRDVKESVINLLDKLIMGRR